MRKVVTVEEGGSSYVVSPAESLEVSVTIRFDHPLIGRQFYSHVVDTETYEREVENARTFGFLKDAEALRERGLVKGVSLENTVKGKRERIGRMLQMHANQREEIKEILAGDIAACVGLKEVTTGETLCDPAAIITLEKMVFPEPVISQAVEPKTKVDQEKMGVALGRLAQEDPSFRVRTDEESGQTIISGMGELHLEIIVDRMKREFGVEASVGKPQVAYRETFKKAVGLNGVGQKAVNALSISYRAQAVREGQTKVVEFAQGKLKKDHRAAKTNERNGTLIEFTPDESLFGKDFKFRPEFIESMLWNYAFLNRGLEITLVDERVDEERREETFHYKGGLVDFVNHLNSKRDPLHPHIVDISDQSEDAEIELAMQWTNTYTESILTFANNINTHEGGTHEEGFRKALTKAINDFARAKNLLKEKDVNLTGEDVREGLTAVVSVRVKEPQFEGQTKTKLGNTEIRSYVEKTLNRKLPEWLEKYSPEARRIVDKCINAAKARDAARKARELTRHKSGLESGGLPDKLADCSSREPAESELFIVEGKSAAGPAKSARDSETQAILPIRGKILNVEKARLAKALQNAEVQDIITAVGTGSAVHANGCSWCSGFC